jgi:hypothetical protein
MRENAKEYVDGFKAGYRDGFIDGQNAEKKIQSIVEEKVKQKQTEDSGYR